MLTIDAWANRIRALDLRGAKRPDCPTCAARRFEFLDAGPSGRRPVSLCGRNAVQVRPPERGGSVDLPSLASRLSPLAAVTRTTYLLHADLRDGGGGDAPLRLTVFADGRLIVTGTTDLNRARSLYARYVGA